MNKKQQRNYQKADDEVSPGHIRIRDKYEIFAIHVLQKKNRRKERKRGRQKNLLARKCLKRKKKPGITDI